MYTHRTKKVLAGFGHERLGLGTGVGERASIGENCGHCHGSRSNRACINKSLPPRIEPLFSFSDPFDHLVVVVYFRASCLALRSHYLQYSGLHEDTRDCSKVWRDACGATFVLIAEFSSFVCSSEIANLGDYGNSIVRYTSVTESCKSIDGGRDEIETNWSPTSRLPNIR